MHLRILGVVKNVFWCICAYLECLKTFFDAFAHTPRPPETFVQKRYFYCLEWLKTCFNAFAHTSSPPETFFQKRYFWISGVFWCIVAYFQTTKNLFSKRSFWTSGVVKNVFWCICAYFQTTRNCFIKKDIVVYCYHSCARMAGLLCSNVDTRAPWMPRSIHWTGPAQTTDGSLIFYHI